MVADPFGSIFMIDIRVSEKCSERNFRAWTGSLSGLVVVILSPPRAAVSEISRHSRTNSVFFITDVLTDSYPVTKAKPVPDPEGSVGRGVKKNGRPCAKEGPLGDVRERIDLSRDQ